MVDVYSIVLPESGFNYSMSTKYRSKHSSSLHTFSSYKILNTVRYIYSLESDNLISVGNRLSLLKVDYFLISNGVRV